MEDSRKIMQALHQEAEDETLFPNEAVKQLSEPISEEEFKKQIHRAAQIHRASQLWLNCFGRVIWQDRKSVV